MRRIRAAVQAAPQRFVDYRHADRFRAAPNWTIDVIETGAFPHFERLSEVTGRYDAFLARLGA